MKEKDTISQRSEFLEAMNQARDVLDGFFFTSLPLRALGYDDDQVSLIHRLYVPVKDGRPTQVFGKEEGWLLSARFVSSLGVFIIGKKISNDYSCVATVYREHVLGFQKNTDLIVYLLNKGGQREPFSIDQVVEHMLINSKFKKQTNIENQLQYIPFLGQQINSKRYEYFYLDETTKKDIVIHFIGGDNYDVWRKIQTKSLGFEVWGRRNDIDKDKIKTLISQKKEKRLLVLSTGNSVV